MTGGPAASDCAAEWRCGGGGMDVLVYRYPLVAQSLGKMEAVPGAGWGVVLFDLNCVLKQLKSQFSSCIEAT